jgi:hypothetical protein
MKRCDAGFRKPVFAPFWNRLSERTLETHQLGPINLKLLGLNSLSFHSPNPVNGFGSSDEHFLWVASSESTRTSERPRIHDRNLPSRFATARRHRRGG